MSSPLRPRLPLLILTALATVVAVAFFSLQPTRQPSSPANAARPTAAPAPSPIPLAPPPQSDPISDLQSFSPTALPASSPTAALLAWHDRYLAAPSADRPALLPEGLALARERRTLLSALIRTDPEAAVAAALPRATRANLPAELLGELEELVSARAELAVIQTCFHRPGTTHNHADDLYRATVINNREYRVHVYGSRLRDASLPATSLIGIALDGHLAVTDARHRILPPEEAAAASTSLPDAVASTLQPSNPSALQPFSPTSLAVEADGRVTLLPSPSALPEFVATLTASEQNPVILEADSGAGSSTVSGRPTQAWTHGDKRLLVIRVDFSDLTGPPLDAYAANAEFTPSYIDTKVNGANGVRAFLQQSSFGKTDLLFNSATDVTGVLRLPNTATSYAAADANTLLHTHARAAATTAGFNLANYDRIAVVFNDLSDLPGSQISYAGLASIIGSSFWLNGTFSFSVSTHELGHTYGLRHANLWQVPATNPVALTGATSTEYGDTFDLMGDGNAFENDFSHWNKSLLQWIPDSAVTLANTGGTYRIYRFDSSSANLASPRALKIVRDTTRDYWIGYRRATSSAAADNGAYVLWGYNTNQQGNLLDLVTPGTNPDDAPLPLNTAFNDSAGGITLLPVAQGGSGADEWLDVQVTFQPRLAWSASSYVVNEQGGSAVLTVNRANNPTGTVTVAYATTAGTATATTDYTTSAGTLTWLNGDTTPKTVTIPLVADALVEGTETFTVTLSAPTGGAVIVDPLIATVTVADPGARDPSFTMPLTGSSINRVLAQPDGNILVAGAFPFIQTPDFAVYDYARIARITPSAGIDPGFDPGTGANNTVQSLARQPDGKILLGGDFTDVGGTARTRLARLLSDGSVDPTFTVGTGPDGTVNDILVQPDGKILIGGSFTSYAGTPRNGLARLLPSGALDNTFADFTGPVVFRINALALQPDGKLLVAGSFYFQTGNLRAGLRRLLTDGTNDASFNGITTGAEDAFNPSFLGSVETLSLQLNGQIIVGGDFSTFNGTARMGIARLSPTGALDNTFTPSLNSGAYALQSLPDGRILVGGDFTTVGGLNATRIARLQSNGSLDTAFAAAGGMSNSVRDFALQPDGNILVSGFISTFQGSASSRPLWRIVPGLSALPGVIQFSADTFAAAEGASATLTVTRTGGSLGALTVGYSTVAGTATSGSDYTTTSGVLTWADGDTATKTITVPLSLDGVSELAETFTVNLGAPLLGGALLGARQQAVVTVASAFSTWQAANFTSLELANSSISGDTADPDADGLNNLLEYAFGLAPKTASTVGTPTTAVQAISGSDYLTLTFRRRTPALDLAYTVQTSGDIGGVWAGGAVQVGSATANGDGTETVTFRDSTALTGGAKRFLRIQTTRTP